MVQTREVMNITLEVTDTIVPEPSTALLFSGGLLALGIKRSRKEN